MKKINLKNLIELYWKSENACTDLTVRARRYSSYSKEEQDVFLASYRKAAYEIEQEYRGACNDAFQSLLKEVQGRATARTIDEPWTIINQTTHIIKKLNIPKKAMAGVSVDVDYHAQKFPSAYRFMPESTHFRIEFNNTGLPFLTKVWRGKCTNNRYAVSLTDEAKAAIIKKAETLYE